MRLAAICPIHGEPARREGVWGSHSPCESDGVQNKELQFEKAQKSSAASKASWARAWLPPDGLPPMPPEIPDPDPAPPPIENPGNMPVPPITDPDVVEPGEPNPGHIPTRVFDEPQCLDESAGLTLALAGSRRRDENSNLFPNPALESTTTVADAANPSTKVSNRAQLRTIDLAENGE
jgi:hypothetical protein